MRYFAVEQTQRHRDAGEEGDPLSVSMCEPRRRQEREDGRKAPRPPKRETADRADKSRSRAHPVTASGVPRRHEKHWRRRPSAARPLEAGPVIDERARLLPSPPPAATACSGASASITLRYEEVKLALLSLDKKTQNRWHRHPSRGWAAGATAASTTARSWRGRRCARRPRRSRGCRCFQEDSVHFNFVFSVSQCLCGFGGGRGIWHLVSCILYPGGWGICVICGFLKGGSAPSWRLRVFAVFNTMIANRL
jgi:hypothetical protein